MVRSVRARRSGERGCVMLERYELGGPVIVEVHFASLGGRAYAEVRLRASVGALCWNVADRGDASRGPKDGQRPRAISPEHRPPGNT